MFYHAIMERRNDIEREERLRKTRSRIANRMRPILQNMPAEDFNRLVEQMAEVEIKYQLRRAQEDVPNHGHAAHRSA
jgi:hypothetical protein